MAYSIQLAGQDITAYVDQMSVEIDDTLGQGAGAGSGTATQGRASTVKFNTNLGPMSTAYGAGQALPINNLYSPPWSNTTDPSGVVTGGTAVVSDATVYNVGKSSFRCTTNGAATFESAYFPLDASIYAPNTHYTLGIWIKGTGTFRIYEQSSAGSIGGTSSTTYTLTGGWQYITRTFTTSSPLGFTGAGLRVDTGGTIQRTTYWINTIVLQTDAMLAMLPVLVRQGEIIITDSTNTVVFGGFATKYTDTSTSILGQTKQNFTTVQGVDYSTSLQRTLVNEVFTGATDIYIIQYIMNKYVGWVNLQYLPTNPGYTFATKNFRNVSVEQVIQTVAGITGYLAFVDYLKNIHYVSPTTASSAPFNLSSAPDFVTTFPHAVEEYLVDDNSAINRVFFYGGTKTSVDFWQDISPLANGNNVTFPLAYYPSPMTDGKYHLQINGVDQTIATSTSSGASGQFVSQGGTATVLIDPGAKAITFDAGSAPATGTQLLAGYRYSFPLSLIITDESSHQYFGTYLDGSIDDNTIFDITTAIQRCKVLLAQQNYGLTTLKLEVYNKPGVQAGMIIHVYNALRGINGTYLVQEVQTSPLGAGNFVYHLSLGAWNWNLIDFLMKLPTLATFQDNQTETQETVNIVQVLTNVKVHDAWSSKTSTQGLYYARATPVGDGHDAYPGFSTVTS